MKVPPLQQLQSDSRTRSLMLLPSPHFIFLLASGTTTSAKLPWFCPFKFLQTNLLFFPRTLVCNLIWSYLPAVAFCGLKGGFKKGRQLVSPEFQVLFQIGPHNSTPSSSKARGRTDPARRLVAPARATLPWEAPPGLPGPRHARRPPSSPGSPTRLRFHLLFAA